MPNSGHVRAARSYKNLLSNFLVLSLLLCLTGLTAACGGLSQGATASTNTSSSQTTPAGQLMVSIPSQQATVGVPYNAVSSVSGGSAPYFFRISDGSLPPGLVLNSSTGSVTGTPLVAGTYNSVLWVSDSLQSDRRQKEYGSNSVRHGSSSMRIVVSDGSSGTKISISPSSTTILSSGQQHFTANISGTADTSVTWSASAGTISSSGAFTAPKVTKNTSVIITATSVAKPSSHAAATAAVNPLAPLAVATSVLAAADAGMPYTASLSAAGGVAPYHWSLASGAMPSGIQLQASSGVITGMTALTGSYRFTAKVADASGQTATLALTLTVSPTVPSSSNSGFDGPAELPRTKVQSSLADTPAPGKTIRVNAGGDLQAAINSANCGDTVAISASGTFTGTFTLPNKNCDDAHWVILRTAAPDSNLPPEGTRLTPCYAGVIALPGRPAYPCPNASRVLPKIMARGNNAIKAAAGANHYRLMGLEVTHPSGMPTGQPDTLLFLGGSPVPNHIIIDRCWIHGNTTDFLKRGVMLNGSYLAVVESTVTDVHAVDTATQGILSGTSPGPLKISDNFVEGGDSAVGFGGEPNTYGNPSDVEVRRNHLFKPMSWRYGDPSYLGFAFSAKVALESKNSVRVLIEGNIMENTWGGPKGGPPQGGDGSIAWLGPKNDNCLCQVTDITVRNNIIRHAGAGFYIFDAPADTGAIAVQGGRFSIHDNLFEDINASYAENGSGFGIIHRFLGIELFPPPSNVLIAHNTGFTTGPNSAALSLDTTSNAPFIDFTFRDNLETSGKWGILGCHGLYGPAVLTNCAPGHTSAGNALIGATGKLAAIPGNYFPADGSAVGFVNYQSGKGGDYRLCRGFGDPAPSCTEASPYLGKGSDGRDIGADIDAVNAATAGVN